MLNIYIYIAFSSLIQYCSMIRVLLIGLGILEENEELQATCTLQSEGHQAAWPLVPETALCLVSTYKTLRSREVWGCQTEMHRSLRLWAALSLDSRCVVHLFWRGIKIYGESYLRNFFQESWRTQHPVAIYWCLNLEIPFEAQFLGLAGKLLFAAFAKILGIVSRFWGTWPTIHCKYTGVQSSIDTSELKLVRSSQRRRTSDGSIAQYTEIRHPQQQQKEDQKLVLKRQSTST